MNTIKIPQLIGSQLESWKALQEISSQFVEGWTLIGGQLVQLHCWERNATPNRVTNDLDAVLNVFTAPNILKQITKYLSEIGFEALTSQEGCQYKWKRDQAEIDILLPDHLGERARKRIGFMGKPSLETPGGRKVLDYSERVKVELNDESFLINRPSLVGALFIKSIAAGNANDIAADRHLEDFATLASTFNTSDSGTRIPKKIRDVIETGVGRLRTRPEITAQISGAEEGLQRVTLALTN